MRPVTAAAAALVILALVPLGPVGAAQDDATPHLLTTQELNRTREAGDAPLILRGSAVAPRAAEMRPVVAHWQVVGGRRLWLIDPVTEEFRTCGVRNTSTVGVKEVRCVSGSASRFHRTFGPNFAP